MAGQGVISRWGGCCGTPRGADQETQWVDDYLTYHFVASPAELGLDQVLLEEGINWVRKIGQ